MNHNTFIEQKIKNFKSLLQNEENLYYGKSTIQNEIRNDQNYNEETITDLCKSLLKDNLLKKDSSKDHQNSLLKKEDDYNALILGVLCGERVRMQNLRMTNSSDPTNNTTNILGKEYKDNMDVINKLLFEEYSKFLRYPNINSEDKQVLYKKWLNVLSGSIDHVKVIKNPQETIIYYSDHVTRMQKIIYNKDEELQKFVIPQFSNKEFVALNIDDIAKNTNLDTIPDELKRDLKPFNYVNLENTNEGHIPILLDMKFEDFNNECDGVNVSCLHMPIKISKSFADNFNNEGRRDPNGNMFDHNLLYIPAEFAKKDMLDLLKYSVAMEVNINRERLDSNFILLTFRTDNLEPSQSLGKTGWHIDGHQGVERIQKDGKKVAIDRVYCVSNTLPTQYSDIRLDLSQIRNLAECESLTLDQYNIQSIIQQTVQKADKECKTVIHEAPENRVFYANPYVIHQSQVNNTQAPIKRHFARVLFSVDERDRIGDTVSPIFGPIYPFKIKQIIDIKQPPTDNNLYMYKHDPMKLQL